MPEYLEYNHGFRNWQCPGSNETYELSVNDSKLCPTCGIELEVYY